MSIRVIMDRFYNEMRSNRWIGYFTMFTRVALAAGFIPSGMVKIMGNRFTSLSVNHPMGHYLEALHHTNFYYPFIGLVQVLAAILLLIPRTATLGALLYLPIILNICILSLAVRFEGSMVTSPLMVLANVYLLCWEYQKLKYIVSPRQGTNDTFKNHQLHQSTRFPVGFFAVVAGIVVTVVVVIVNAFDVVPRNTLRDCRKQFEGTNRVEAGDEFCDCIHKYGRSLDSSLRQYYQAADDSIEPYLEPLMPSGFYLEY